MVLFSHPSEYYEKCEGVYALRLIKDSYTAKGKGQYTISLGRFQHLIQQSREEASTSHSEHRDLEARVDQAVQYLWDGSELVRQLQADHTSVDGLDGILNTMSRATKEKAGSRTAPSQSRATLYDFVLTAKPFTCCLYSRDHPHARKEALRAICGFTFGRSCQAEAHGEPYRLLKVFGVAERYYPSFLT